jgi:hypothetical protein
MERLSGHSADYPHVLNFARGLDVYAPVPKQHGSLVCRLGFDASSRIVERGALGALADAGQRL